MSGGRRPWGVSHGHVTTAFVHQHRARDAARRLVAYYGEPVRLVHRGSDGAWSLQELFLPEGGSRVRDVAPPAPCCTDEDGPCDRHNPYLEVIT